MSPKLEDFLSDPTSIEKELIRKLYWAISSTIPLSREAKAGTFRWSVQLGQRIIGRLANTPPSAFRASPTPLERSVPPLPHELESGYDGQAEGGVAGRSKARSRPSFEASPRRGGPPQPPSQAFLDTQACLQARALQYMSNGSKGGLN